MGKAERRSAAERALAEKAMENVDLPRLALAMKKLATAASGQLGGDCYVHAAIAQAMFSRLGVPASVKIGYAAWRVSGGDSDVITHCAVPGMVAQPGMAYHVWLSIGNYILDLTTYSLPEKCRQLDELDGGTTACDWHPDFLYVPKSSVSSLRDVTQLTTGLYYYQEDPALAETVIAAASDLDMHDVELAWIIYNNADIKVFGPNTMEAFKSGEKQ